MFALLTGSAHFIRWGTHTVCAGEWSLHSLGNVWLAPHGEYSLRECLMLSDASQGLLAALVGDVRVAHGERSFHSLGNAHGVCWGMVVALPGECSASASRRMLAAQAGNVIITI